MKHGLIVLALVVNLLLALPRPALAQTGRQCAEMDFTLDSYGWGAGYGEHVPGKGFSSVFTTAEVLEIEYTDSSYTVDSIEATWYIETWGGGAGDVPDNTIIANTGGISVYLVDTPASETPATQVFEWSVAEVEGWLSMYFYASNVGGSSSAQGYLRSLTVCGYSLPSEWGPALVSYTDPWPTDEGWSRATPTPWPTPEATLPFGVVDSDIGGLADNAINLYNFANQTGAIDTLIWILMSLLILALIFRFMKKAKAGT